MSNATTTPRFRCSRCGAGNLASAPKCENCGARFSTTSTHPVASQASDFRRKNIPDGTPKQGNLAFCRPPEYPKSFLSFLEFDGRASRREFWITHCMIAVAKVGTMITVANAPLFFAGRRTPESATLIFALFSIPVFLLLIWAYAAVQIRRWHDLGRSGFYVLINLLPFGVPASVLMLGFSPGESGGNRYGVDPQQRVAKPESPA